MEAAPWLQKRLSNLTPRGEDRLRQPVPAGQLEMTMTWRFEPA
jgi:hypothetical protein